MEKKERLKPLSLYGYDLKQAIRAILSVNPKKLKTAEEPMEAKLVEKPNRKNKTKK